MTTTTSRESEQLHGDEAGLVNTTRGQLKSFLDKMGALIDEGRDTLVDMDARLCDFDGNSRRLEPTTAEKQHRK